MRVLLRVLAPLLGLALAATGAVLVIEVVARWMLGTRRDGTGLLVPWPGWRTSLYTLTWHDLMMLLVCAGLALLGLVLLVLAATARRRDLRLDDPAAEVSVTTTPRVLARLVGQQVRSGEHVASASVTVSPRAVKVVVICRGEVSDGMRAAVVERASTLLDELPLSRRPRLAVSVRSDGGPR